MTYISGTVLNNKIIVIIKKKTNKQIKLLPLTHIFYPQQ